MIPTSNSVKRVYEQVLLEIPQIEPRRFIHRFNQAINELAMQYPASMTIVGAEIDTSYDYSLIEWREFDDSGLFYLNLEALDKTWEEISSGEGIKETTVREDGIYPHIYPLPLNCAGVYKVFLVSGEKTSECKDYTVTDGGIKFPVKGLYRVYYYRKTEIQTIDDTVTLPWQFFNAIVYFIIGNELMDVNEQKAVFNMQRFSESARLANKNIKSQKIRNKRIKAPIWR